MRKWMLAFCLIFPLQLVLGQNKNNWVDYVNPLVGSKSSHSFSNGNTYPAIAQPWGMNFWTPQTASMNDGWIYTYDADKINGFKQTHQPSPWLNDYCQFALMPTTGKTVFDESERASWFSHKAEIAKPYFYQVYLADHDVTTALTTTSRTAFFRFTFPQNDSSSVVIDAMDGDSYVKIIPEERKVIGYTTKNNNAERKLPEGFRNYFVIVFDKPFAYQYIIQNDVKSIKPTEAKAGHTGAIVGFRTSRGEKINARVASSFISSEQAEQNLSAEQGNRSFEQLKDASRQNWNSMLGRIDVQDDHIDNLRTFYSCLYRSLLFPRTFYEINAKGDTLHQSPYDGKLHDGVLFTDVGFWDTFRSLFPLLNLVYPDQSLPIQKGLVNAYRESGFLPEWASPGHFNSMIGNNSASVVADAFLGGLRGYDIEKLWDAVVHGTNHAHPGYSSVGRLGYEYYNQLGYIPSDAGIKESAARTLEYAYSDWCIYQLGKALHKSKKEIGIFAQRAMNYKKLFDTSHCLISGRRQNGTFDKNFNPFKWGDAFTEGNSWHYSWSVFHDPQGLIDLMGGRDRFNHMLDSVFTLPPVYDDSYYGSVIHEIREMMTVNMGQYAHGNQPIQHMTYLYDYSGEPWKTQYWVRETMDKLYNANPDGYCGDEDNGQTSAWYVFSALGFYPVCPGSNQYAIGSPLFKNVKIVLQNGKDIILQAQGNATHKRYISKIAVDGKGYELNYLKKDMLEQGATVNFLMADHPNKRRGITSKSAPYSFSLDSKLLKQ